MKLKEVLAALIVIIIGLWLPVGASELRCEAVYDRELKNVCLNLFLENGAFCGCSFLVNYHEQASYLSAHTDADAVLTSNGVFAVQTGKFSMASAYPLPTDRSLVQIRFDVSAVDSSFVTFAFCQIKAADETGSKTLLPDFECCISIAEDEQEEQSDSGDSSDTHRRVSAYVMPQKDASGASDTDNRSDGYNEAERLLRHQIILTIDDRAALVFGEQVTNDVAPKIVSDRTMLPARFIAEALGAEVCWFDEERKVSILKGDTVILIFIDSDTAFVNGEDVLLDSPAFIENDRTYLPIRFISEHLGAVVDWKEDTKQVIITAE